MARMDNNRLSDFKQAPAYLRKKILIIKSKQGIEETITDYKSITLPRG